MAFDKDNKILGLRVKTHANFGAYMSLFSSSVPTYLYATLLSGQYIIPAIYAEVMAVYTNTTPVDAYRGAGRPEASYLLERMMETAARQLKVDPTELRRKNFITSFPYQTPVIMAYDAGDFNASLDAAMKAIDYAGFPARKAKAKSEGKLRGLGVSCYIEACGIAPSKAVGSLGAGVGLWESAEIRVNPVGTIEVLTGSHSHGQSHETTFAQLIAERLGVPISQVSIVHGDTDKVQFGMGTYGSRSIAVGGTAIIKAMEKVEAKAKKIAAHQLEASENDIVIENGEFKVTGTDKSIALPMVALAAYTAHNLPDGMEPGLKETAFYDPTNFTFPAGSYICEVEVDAATGKTSFVNFVAADDFGRLINPMVVEGQVHGGLAQGIGQALLEHAVYDANAQPITASFMDYTMPRADDLPSFKVSHTTTLCPSNPLGVKGCGVDVIHDHTLIGPLVGGARRSPIPVVTTNHGLFDDHLRSIFRELSRVSSVVAISHSQASTSGDVPIAAVIHHGVRLERFPIGRGDGGYALFLGRMASTKGVVPAIHAAACCRCEAGDRSQVLGGR